MLITCSLCCLNAQKHGYSFPTNNAVPYGTSAGRVVEFPRVPLNSESPQKPRRFPATFLKPFPDKIRHDLGRGRVKAYHVQHSGIIRVGNAKTI